MENKYIISESQLINFLVVYHYANCLEEAGVDNWIWYMTNKEKYLGNFKSFTDKAKDDLKYYTKIEV